ncbi:MAG: glycyl-tRNA synthetase subunit beta [Candidatus Bathyarchaeota archaeon B63]|nr:MAG: glycyl-tRNA synthetase subunit beta [Candidatus Bathyarchaeota archaeon B63]
MGEQTLKADKYEKISALARRRGFFWPSYEIYGGVSGFINWGPLGSVMKRRIEDKFRDIFIRRLGLYEIETPIISPEVVFKASGHLESFREPMVECGDCKRRFRADHLLQEFADLPSQETDRMRLAEIKGAIEEHGIRCPDCGGPLGEPKYFLTMFKTTIGPYSDVVGYGRPEAAQGIFVEFRRLYEQVRERLPVGFAVIGHALRNEISPRQGPMRLREFTIIDLEFFIDPESPGCPLLKRVEDETLNMVLAENRLRGSEEPVKLTVRDAVARGYIKMEWQAFFMALAKRFLEELGVPDEKQRFIEKLDWERAHYSTQGFDQEVYLDRWGWVEVSGFNDRTDFDLKGHMRESGEDMRVFKTREKPKVRKERILKPVIRNIRRDFREEMGRVLNLLSKTRPEEIEKHLKEKGYFMLGGFRILPSHVKFEERVTEEKGRRFIPHVIEPSFGSDRLTYVALEYAYTVKDGRVILRLPRDIAPVQLAVLPLVQRDGLPEKARGIYEALIEEGFTVEYDEAGSIGRRYARFDEIGTPICITVDYETLKDGTVTLRDRDSWKQVRTGVKQLPRLLWDFFRFKMDFTGLGSPVGEKS